MPRVMKEIAEYIYNLRESETVEAAFAILQKQLASALGIDRAVYSLMTDFHSISLPAGHAILGNYPEDWMLHYQQNGYEDVDPVRKVLLHTGQPFIWSDLQTYKDLEHSERTLMGEAQDARLHDGVGLGLHCPHGEIIGMGFASSAGGVNLCPYTLAMIRLYAVEFHDTFIRLNAHRMRRFPSRLTRREVEILIWMSRGKTAPEIAQILSVEGSLSTSTIKFHIRNIYLKLEVNCAVSAVTKAIALGILTRADFNHYI